MQLEGIELARGPDVDSALHDHELAILDNPVGGRGAVDGFPSVKILPVEERHRIGPGGGSAALQVRRGHAHQRNGLIAALLNAGDLSAGNVEFEGHGGAPLGGLVDDNGHVRSAEVKALDRHNMAFVSLEEDLQLAVFFAHAEPAAVADPAGVRGRSEREVPTAQIRVRGLRRCCHDLHETKQKCNSGCSHVERL